MCKTKTTSIDKTSLRELCDSKLSGLRTSDMIAISLR